MLKINKSEPLYQQVYDQLKQHILDGGWNPGEKLIESKIEKNLKLRRSPVRETMGILKHKGFLVKRWKKLYVLQPDLNDIIELYQLRQSIESLACALAAEIATVDEIEDLREILEQTVADLKEGNTSEIYQCNTRFHEAIIRASGNSHLISVMNGLRAKVLYCRNVLVQFAYVRVDSFIDEHFNIYQAIRDGRGDDAKLLMEKHIRIDLDCILALFPNEVLEGGWQ